MSTKYSGSMNDYADAARKAGLIDLANILHEDEQIKSDGQKTLERFRLPTLRQTTLPLSDFIKNSDDHFSVLISDLYHVTLLSDIDGKGRIRAFPFKRHQVIKFINKNITLDERKKVTMILKEFYPNMFGGNIIVGNDGRVILEVVSGDHIHVVLGDTEIIAFGHRISHFKRLIIYTDFHRTALLKDRKLRQALEKTVNYLYHPGYYEFVIAKNRKNQFQPIFIDYRNREIYQLKSHRINF